MSATTALGLRRLGPYSDDMVTAVKSGTYADSYGVHRIEAGCTRIAKDSTDLERADVRELFGLGSSPQRAAVPAAPPTREARVLEDPELRENEPSPVEVVLGRLARETMLDDLFCLTRTDGLESGGFLFARPLRSWDKCKRVEIIQATPTGAAQRSSGSLKLDSAEWLRAERAIDADESGLVLSGLWHAHPATREARPSSADLRGFLAALDWGEEMRRSTTVSVGLIYAASEYLGDSWARPRLSAWAVTRDGYSRRPVCRPATIRERR